jgi:peptidoglycan/LPS O-acetylase OafA/YrhL
VKLDLRETTLMKGIGILLIIGHNFQYRVDGLPGVNEFVFAPENAVAFVDALRASPVSTPRLVLAFLGHYGVQLFIFLSAYGLARSFQKRVPTYREFLRSRVVKIYPTFLLAILAWAIWKGFPSGVGTSVLLKLSLISNLVPGEQLKLVGPWWFLPFIVQFYLLFPLLFRVPTRGLVAASLAAFAFTVGMNETLLPDGYLYATPIGHLPEFCLGIWWARTSPARVHPGFALLAVLAFLAGNVWQGAWYLTHVSVLLLVLFAWPAVSRVLSRAQTAVLFIGTISFELFLVNGFTRDPFLTWAREAGTEGAAWGYGALSFASALGVSLLLYALRNRALPLPSGGEG